MKFRPFSVPEFRSLLVLVVTLVSACGPRGETKSVDEVLQGEKQRFFQQAEMKLPEDVRKELTQAAGALEDLDRIGEGNPSSGALDSLILALRSLHVRAGYTTRPALFEILEQWRQIREESASASDAQWKLLSARTYGLLSSELKGVRFALKDRELKL